MQSVSSRVWTGVAVSISYDDNNYTTGTSIQNFLVDAQKRKPEIKRMREINHLKLRRFTHFPSVYIYVCLCVCFN